jgi:glycosyltransferase involved in cell wall biosynthesis
MVVGGVWPHSRKNKEAANVVSYNILLELAKSKTFDLSFLCVNDYDVEIPSGAEPDISELKELGVQFFPQVYLDKTLYSQSTVKKIWAAKKEPRWLMQGWGQKKAIDTVIGDYKPDALLTIWTEKGTRAVSDLKCLKYAYYGNPDDKVFRASYTINKLAGNHIIAFKQKILHTAIGNAVSRAHLTIMKEFHWVFNVAQNDAAYYRQEGISSSYLQMTWDGDINSEWKTVRDNTEITTPVKIVGSVGNQFATGNSFAFITLVKEVLPKLRQKLGDRNFEIHIYGGGWPRPGIARMLNDPHIKIRGFVDDLDAEILSAPIVLIPHNFHKFKVSHTRFLHSWSLGACIVAFEDAAISMPEIVHNKNALLAKNSQEMAEHILEAVKNRGLRRKLGQGGVETLAESFTSKKVTGKIISAIKGELA